MYSIKYGAVSLQYFYTLEKSTNTFVDIVDKIKIQSKQIQSKITENS